MRIATPLPYIFAYAIELKFEGERNFDDIRAFPQAFLSVWWILQMFCGVFFINGWDK